MGFSTSYEERKCRSLNAAVRDGLIITLNRNGAAQIESMASRALRDEVEKFTHVSKCNRTNDSGRGDVG